MAVKTKLVLVFAVLGRAAAYVASQHPSVKAYTIKQPKPDAGKELPPTLADSKTKRVRLEPVMDRNPLEHLNNGPDIVIDTNVHPEVSISKLLEIPATPGSLDQAHKAWTKSPLFARNSPPQVVSREKGEDETRQSIFVAASAGLAGFTDVLCLAQFGCFVNMMTGNLLKMTTALANCQRGEASLHALFVFSYTMGLTLFSVIQDTANRWKDNISEDGPKLEPLSLVAPVVAVLFASADLLVRGSTKAVQVPCLAMGFGLVNAASAYATGGIFFALTGHLTRVANALLETVKTRVWALDEATRKSLSIIRCFLGGAFLAALLVRWQAVPLPLCSGLGLLYTTLFFLVCTLDARAPHHTRGLGG